MSPANVGPAKIVRLYPVLDFGGVETRARIQNLLSDREHFDVEFWTFHRAGASADQIRDAGGTVRVLDVEPNPRSLTPTRQLYEMLLTSRPDLLHTSIAEANLHGALAATAADIPVICEDVGQPSRGLIGRSIFSMVWRLSEFSIAVSEVTRAWMVDRDHAPEDRVRVLYNCALPRYFEPVSSRFSGKGNLDVILVGRLTKVKNQAMFIRAFSAASEQLSELSLTICGEGELREELEQLVRDLGISDRVRFLGRVDRVRELLDEADLFVLPSLSEGCSISLIEAMARGRMVLTSDAKGNVEVLRQHARERTLPVHSVPAWTKAILDHAALDTEARQVFGRSLRDFAQEHYSPSAYVRRLESFYREVLE